MKQIFTAMAAAIILGGSYMVMAQTPAGGTGSAAPAPRPQRIYIVNIAKVLREFDQANYNGQEITKKRQAYVNRVTAIKDQITAKNAEFVKAVDPTVKKRLEDEARALNRQIEDIDREAQTILTRESNETIVDVYQKIKAVIHDVAKANDIDMVLCYPAASDPKDENSPAVAQLMLQTPAMIPFYHSKMDITSVVVQTLNARHALRPDQKLDRNVQPVAGPGGVPPK